MTTPYNGEPSMTTDLQLSFSRVRDEVGKAVVGQDSAVSGLIVTLLAGGHALLEGVPGVAKTLLVRALSHALSLETTRVQFTPDLMPGDITGSLVYDSKAGEFEFREGPVFTNILLADEINRTPRRRSRRSSKPWRSARSRSTESPGAFRCRSSWQPP
ncbi:hypothetical protein GCM10025867_37170 [Frondihabitans sucicola]|uniref:ATPase AAA-3 domain-containing protein n=1 Tax=Frondihabitans sucicola TaxID=1268041 RepID=A0ABM8GSM8_9MICO|nr:hypothetical protein GCM10025867_37170 [Frondihabitans sucicola]